MSLHSFSFFLKRISSLSPQHPFVFVGWSTKFWPLQELFEPQPRQDSGRLHGGHQLRPRCAARGKSGAGAVWNRVSSREKRGKNGGGFHQEWIELISPASVGELGSLNHQMVHGDMRNMTQLVYLVWHTGM